MENWKEIKGYDGIYEVSDLGNIRKMFTTINHPNTVNLKIIISSDGYGVVNLTKGGVKKQFRVHRLVALAFIENPLNKPFINHKDAVRSNNNVLNLEWCTQKENIQHAWNIGNAKPGEFNGNSKLTPDKVLKIREIKLSKKLPSKEIAAMFGLEKSTIDKIVKRKLWAHL